MKTFLTVKLILACLPLVLFVAVLFQKNFIADKTFGLASASRSAKSFLNVRAQPSQTMISTTAFMTLRKF
ncbi:hypothetical protein [Flavisolibacter ginsenosidimutans]|uniref:Uncharacterized protein n=1 Tax=Flavisolibacter ginsenosidimutans TaxID=661481 RepID=A0A5B8UMD7_9BACT|nr:hypothetical protein [Flavisolibacter ginsenosidimutans]QEC57728.1 hypothetical protein FSB75_18070 [Flavisolibacter ginsenosidimutans]